MRRRKKEILLLLIVVALVAVFVRDRSVENSYPRVTMKLNGVTSAQAVQRVCDDLGLKVVGRRLDLTGSNFDDFEFVDAPVSEVFDRLAGEWKLVSDQLVLIPLNSKVPYCPIRMEYRLENISASELAPLLRVVFPGAGLTPHPTINGLFAAGSKRDLLDIKHIVRELDGQRRETVPRLVLIHLVQSLDVAKLCSQLKTKYPEVEVSVDEKFLKLSGPFVSTGQALDFLQTVDRTVMTVPVSLAALRLAEPSCRIDEPSFNPTVSCPQTPCPGPLHLLGLKQGDVLPAYRNDDLRTKPEWWVVRNGKNLRIILDMKP